MSIPPDGEGSPSGDPVRHKHPGRVAAGQARQRQLRQELGEDGYREHLRQRARAANAAQLAAWGAEGYREQRRRAYQALVAMYGDQVARKLAKKGSEARRLIRLDHPNAGEQELRAALTALGFTLILPREPVNWLDSPAMAQMDPTAAVIECGAGTYICDARIPSIGLAIEVFGGIHTLTAARDARKLADLEAMGLRVLVLAFPCTSDAMQQAITAAIPQE